MLVLILFICLATFANGKLCENSQFWSLILEKCETCSRCVPPDIVLRPCQGNADTVCGPLSELNIDWTWLKNQGSHSSASSKNENHSKGMLDTFKENSVQIRQHEQHVKEKQRYLRRKHNRDSDEGEIESGDIFVGDRYHSKKVQKVGSEKNLADKLKFLNKYRSHEERVYDNVTPRSNRNKNHLEEMITTKKKWPKLHHGQTNGLHFNGKEALELLKSSRKPVKKEIEIYDPNHLNFDENGILVKNFEFTKVEDNVKMEKLIDNSKFPEDFSPTEKFILDWQTVILGIAVSSCVVFFLVAAIYSFQHARHWKKLINYFDSDIEELQTWISSKSPENKTPSSGIYKTTTEVVHTEGNQCKYLERIIRMNGKTRFNLVTGNVYEKDNNRPSELKPLTKKYPVVHKSTGDQL